MTELERMGFVSSKLGGTSYLDMPASIRYHGNHAGGLNEHCVNVWINLDKLTRNMHLDWKRSSSPFVISMLHDACKIDMYKYNDEKSCWEYNTEHPLGHGDLSLEVAEKLGIELTDEEKACIRWHMGAFDDMENWSKYTEAIHKYPNVLWTHTADMMAAHIDEIEWEDEHEHRADES